MGGERGKKLKQPEAKDVRAEESQLSARETDSQRPPAKAKCGLCSVGKCAA